MEELERHLQSKIDVPISNVASPICQEGQSERTFPIFPVFFDSFPIFPLFFPIFSLFFPIFDNFFAVKDSSLLATGSDRVFYVTVADADAEVWNIICNPYTYLFYMLAKFEQSLSRYANYTECWAFWENRCKEIESPG